MSVFRKAVTASMGGLFAALWCGAAVGQPKLELTHVPPYGSFEGLEGRATGVTPGEAKVAVVIFVPGAGWWSKPTAASPLTSLRPDGTWTAQVTTGGTDHKATRIAVFLLPASYDGRPVLGGAELPATLEKQALATVVAVREEPKRRTIRFAREEWAVKSSPHRWGPGPNYFSDSEKNVSVDPQGRLHLRITHRDGKWQCAEVVSERTFGYGTYRFVLDCPVDDLDRNVVLGLFTWSDDPAYAHREIDVEFSRWGDPENDNAQFVVQPYQAPGHIYRFQWPTGLRWSTHSFTWLRDAVSFRSERGESSKPEDPSAVIQQWVYLKDVPQTGDENARINLWLMGGKPPSNGKEVEVVVRDFQFVPAAK